MSEISDLYETRGMETTPFSSVTDSGDDPDRCARHHSGTRHLPAPARATSEMVPCASKYFRTSHLIGDVGSRSARGVVITSLGYGARFAIQLAATMALARLLTPADFGLVAMVSAITGLMGLLSDLGLSAATVQRAEIEHSQVNAMFWISVAFSLFMALLLAAMSPVIVWFYHEPRLLWITLVFASGQICGGLTSQHYALLARQMRFRAMAIVQTLPILVGAPVGIGLAIAGLSYWALVIMAMVQGGLIAACCWIACRWRPTWPKGAGGVKAMLVFGLHLTGFNMLGYLTRNSDNLIVGRFLGSQALGIYSKAYALLLLPVQQINSPVTGVVLPALSRLQHDPSRFRAFFLKAVSGLAFLGMPLTFFTYYDADALVLALLGPKWTGASPIFRLLAPAALVGTINSAPMWIFTSLGLARRQFRWSAVATPVIVGGFIVGLYWGIAGVAASFSITFGATFLVITVDACRHSPIRVGDLVKTLLPPLAASLAATLVLLFCSRMSPATPLAKLMVDGLVFATVYLALCLILPSGRDLVGTLIRHSPLKLARPAGLHRT